MDALHIFQCSPETQSQEDDLMIRRLKNPVIVAPSRCTFPGMLWVAFVVAGHTGVLSWGRQYRTHY